MDKKTKENKRKEPKTTWQKIWYFLWDDDSALSWIVNILIAFVLIKFVIYPGLGLVLGTTHPVVAVVSGSMEHRAVGGIVCGKLPDSYTGSFDDYWATCGDFYTQLGITKEDFSKYSFKNGFNTGDIIVLLGKKPSEINVGDVIVFRSSLPGSTDPIIHRIVKKWTTNGVTYYTTKGDHNPTTLFFENETSQDKVIGKAVFRIPYLGYIKIWFVDFLRLIGLGNTLGKLF